VALPRRRGAFYFLGYARGMAFGLMDPMGEARLLAGQSHCLISGGKAEPNMAEDFWGKAKIITSRRQQLVHSRFTIYDCAARRALTVSRRKRIGVPEA
jgi:hypothetical protein